MKIFPTSQNFSFFDVKKEVLRKVGVPVDQ